MDLAHRGVVSPTLATQLRATASVQAQGDADGEHVHRAAAAGVSGSGGPLPHLERVQASFGPGHDVSGIKAHVGGVAAEASQSIGAAAYATGDQVAFAATPDVHTAAHEAAHVIQQQQGVQLRNGVGRAGDAYERHADAVADRVVAGESAADLLLTGPAGSAGPAQRVESPTVTPTPAQAPRVAQRKARSLADLVTPTGPSSRLAPVQLASLSDYNDKKPEHDPSRVSDTDIKATDEYIALEQTYYLVPTTDPSQLYSPAEILLACKLMLRFMRQGKAVDYKTDGKSYLDQARAQIGTVEKSESMEGDLKWGNQAGLLDATEFGKWLLKGGKEPDASSGQMNCWELVMFSAYKAGFTTKAGMTALYTQFGKDLLKSKNPVTAFGAFEAALQKSSPQAYVPGDASSAKPLRGDIVVFQSMIGHVAVATGKTTSTGEVEIMSLWTQNSGAVYKTSIEALLKDGASKPVRFFSPNW
ncbi:DUF4157 domain-containing protein [Haliangium sp.]|uniref:eCIS core domain-containing protein n=1 Tax=Haliangium sp. TaxID=2663208 RepID=UPI003D121976